MKITVELSEMELLDLQGLIEQLHKGHPGPFGATEYYRHRKRFLETISAIVERANRQRPKL